MPVYVHSFLAPVPSDPQHFVLERPALLSRLVTAGFAALGVGLGVATATIGENPYRLWLGVACVNAVVIAGACLFIARTERVVFDRAARTIRLASGELVSFADVRQLVLATDRDSDGDEAYCLAIDTPRGRIELSRIWCWDKAKVQSAAAALLGAMPDLPVDPSVRG